MDTLHSPSHLALAPLAPPGPPPGEGSMRLSCYNAVLPNLPGPAVGDASAAFLPAVFLTNVPSPHVWSVSHIAETQSEQLHA